MKGAVFKEILCAVDGYAQQPCPAMLLAVKVANPFEVTIEHFGIHIIGIGIVSDIAHCNTEDHVTVKTNNFLVSHAAILPFQPLNSQTVKYI